MFNVREAEGGTSGILASLMPVKRRIDSSQILYQYNVTRKTAS